MKDARIRARGYLFSHAVLVNRSEIAIIVGRGAEESGVFF